MTTIIGLFLMAPLALVILLGLGSAIHQIYLTNKEGALWSAITYALFIIGLLLLAFSK